MDTDCSDVYLALLDKNDSYEMASSPCLEYRLQFLVNNFLSVYICVHLWLNFFAFLRALRVLCGEYAFSE